MSDLILLAGLALVALLAVAALRREWRLPILVFACLAIPGNVDHLMPQMTLDPHQIADATGPAISVIDLLVGWALILTLRERARPPIAATYRWLLLAAGGLAVVTAVTAGVHVLAGVEPAAAVRGVLLFARIGILLVLCAWLADAIGDGTRLAIGAAAGGVVLLANGTYTTVTQAQERFTAATFGRNDFAVALLLVTILCVGLVMRGFSQPSSARRDRALTVVGLVMAGVTLFGAMATGTRAALLALGVAAVAGLILNRSWRTWTGLGRVAATGAYLIVVVVASVLLTSAGGRTTSFLTNPGATVNVIENLGDETSSAEIRTRQQFWDLAVQMIRSDPVVGVGPYQWNVQRYVLDPSSPVVTADAHDTYLQMGAEYGLPAIGLYLLLILAAAVPLARAALQRATFISREWTATSFACAGIAFLIADLTNSNLFNGRTGSAAWLLIGAAVVLGTRNVSVPAPAQAPLET